MPVRRRRFLGSTVLLGFGAVGQDRAGLPEWLLGCWHATEVRQDRAVRYLPGDDPQRWYDGRILTIAPRRLCFADRACERFTVRRSQGPIEDALRPLFGEAAPVFDLPSDRTPVDYLHLHCERNLIDVGDGRGATQEVGIPLTWCLVLRSKDVVDLPFFGGAYIRLRRPDPGC